ncbi:MAG: hypothetical protein JJU12_06545 [Chlamydiales bacterium]|nr:hypothetical protein [Chlamydiales bacterium]
MNILPISPNCETVRSPFIYLSDEIFLTIFLKTIDSSPFWKARAAYSQGRLVSRRFKRIFDDPKIIAALLEKGGALPLKLIRKLPPEGIYISLLKRTYERMLSERMRQNGEAADALPFIESLKEEERAYITRLSLSCLVSLPLNTGTYKENLARLLRQLPKLRTIRFPSGLYAFPPLFQALSEVKGQISGIEMQFIHAQNQIERAVNFFPKLQSFHLEITEKADNASLTYIFKRHPEISELTLLDTSNICLETLELPEEISLKRIRLRGRNFTNLTTQFLLKRFSELESLSLGGTYNDQESIGNILQSTLSLNELNLSQLDVRDEHFLKVSHSLRQSLRKLILYGCPSITEKGIGYLKQAFPHLEQLDTRYCEELQSPYNRTEGSDQV